MIGKKLGNRYEIIEQIGAGGMATVYKAKDSLLNRYVALKVLKSQYVEDAEFKRKFIKEAQSAASLNHQNIVNIFDVGNEEIDGRDVNYIVMEYINGKTLKAEIDQRGIIPVDEMINYSVQIASAIEIAHKNNIIHRDIKPQNIMIDENKTVKVTDFGIARVSSSSTLTYTSSVLGTVHYISPEQAKGKYIDEKSDIYSMGVVMYEMVTGRVPFDAENVVGIALRHIQDPLIPPMELNTSLPPEINYIIVKTLEKNPANRYQSVGELIEDLINYKLIGNKVIHSNQERNRDYTEIISKKDRDELEKAVYNMPIKSKKYDDEEVVVSRKSDFSKKIMMGGIAILFLILLGVLVLAFNPFSTGSSETTVPAVVGIKEDKARQLASEQGLRLRVKSREESADVEEGVIISQDPNSNTKVKKGDEIEVVVSKGLEKIEVPDLTKKEFEGIENYLKQKGFEIGNVRKESSDTVEEGKIISQNPEVGKKVAKNSKIDLVVSKGKEIKKTKVPDLSNLTKDEAMKEIYNAHLTIGDIKNEHSPTVEKGKLISQSIAKNTEVDEGTKIDFVISLGKHEVEEKPKPKQKIYNFNIEKPSESGNYEVRITKITINGEVEVYKKIHSSQEGSYVISLTEEDNSRFKIYIDNELVTITS